MGSSIQYLLCLWITVIQFAHVYTTFRDNLHGPLYDVVDEFGPRPDVRYVTPLANLMKMESFKLNEDGRDEDRPSMMSVPRPARSTSALEERNQCLQTLNGARSNSNRLPTVFCLFTLSRKFRSPHFVAFINGLPMTPDRRLAQAKESLYPWAGARNVIGLTQKRQSSLTPPSRDWCRMLGNKFCQRSVRK